MITFETIHLKGTRGARATSLKAIPRRTFSLDLGKIAFATKIQNSDPITKPTDNALSPLKGHLSARQFDVNPSNNSLRTLSPSPSLILPSVNLTPNQLTTTTIKFPSSKSGFHTSKALPLPKQHIGTARNTKTDNYFTNTDNLLTTKHNPTKIENEGSPNVKKEVNKKKLSNLFKEVIQKSPCKDGPCPKCRTHEYSTLIGHTSSFAGNSFQNFNSTNYLSNLHSARQTSTQLEQSSPNLFSPRISEPNVKYVVVQSASGFNFKTPVELDGKEEDQKAKQPGLHFPNMNQRRPYIPARHLELYHPPTSHRFASDMMYYEKHGELISKQVSERAEKYRRRMGGMLEEYRRKINEDFENRFGVVYAHEELAGSDEGSLAKLDEEFEGKDGVTALTRGKIRSTIIGRTTRTLKSLKSLSNLELTGSKSNLRTVKSYGRPVAIGLPDAATLKVPRGFEKKGDLTRKADKKKSVYNPFERRTKVEESFDEEEEAIRKLIEYKPRLGSILPPQNPLFKSPAKVQGEHMQEIVTGDLKLKLVRPQKINFKFIRVRLIESLRYMKLLKLNPRDLLTQHIFSTAPFEKKNSKEFITACKNDDQETVADLLQKNKFLVYDFDHIHMTALHWAVKRNHFAIVRLLIANGADINAVDLIGRTPLYFAIKYNNIDIMKLLLYSHCDPWSIEECNYLELCKNKPAARYYLGKSRLIHIIMRMTPPRLREVVWEKESMNLVLDPRRSQPKEASTVEED